MVTRPRGNDMSKFCFGMKTWIVIAVFVIAAICLVALIGYWSLIFSALGFGSEAALRRAHGEAAAGNVDEALKWCDEAIRQNSKSIPSYDLRGSLHERRGDYHSAVDDYTRLIELQPDIPDYHIDRGRAYESLGDLDSAVSDYCDAILSDLKGDYTLQAWAETRAGRSGPEALDEMTKVFDKAISRHPQDQRLQECLRSLRHAKTRP